MGFRKSEYRKKFKRVPTEKLIAICSENARYRADRRLRECRHEPLDWDSDGYDSESEENGVLPPTKLRLRHLQLTGRRSGKLDTTSSRESSSCDGGGPVGYRKDAAVQTEKEAKPSCRSRWTQTDEHENQRKGRRCGPRESSPSERRKFDTERRTVRRDPSPFEAYGMANDVDTVSGKRTFNVAATTHEIYPTALMAARRRHVPPSPHRQHSRCRSANVGLLRHGWVSEYGEKYK